MADSGNSASEVVTPQSLLTDTNVREALTADKGANARLTTWKVVNFTETGDNYACVVTSVEVKYELDGQSSEVVYVVKLKPGNKNPLAATVDDLIFEKEVKFYLNLAPELNCMLKKTGQREINFPKCFYASLEKGKEVIFLEDLRKRGFKMLDRKSGLDKAHATVVLREMARLHAASLLLQNNNSGEALDEKFPILKKDMHYLMSVSPMAFMIMKNGLTFSQQILKKVGGYERAIAWIDTLIPSLADIMYEQFKSGEPLVVCHGDCWNNNILFKNDEAGHPVDVMFLDLQMVRYGSATSELNFLLYTSTTGDVRKPNLQAFLKCYHEAFTDIMKTAGQETPFTQEQLLKDYKHRNLIGGICAMVSLPILMFQGGGDEDSAKDSGESVADKLKRARARAMATLDTNPLLKPRFLAIFDDLVADGIIP